MLKDETLSSEERKFVEQCLEDAKSGQLKQRAKRLKKVPVVGVTCAASVFGVLDGNTFPIVILDECSQMVEPLSLLPVGRFLCEKLILVGDPMQLPPTLEARFGKFFSARLFLTNFVS